MSKKISARITTILAATTMALSMQTALNAAAAPEAGQAANLNATSGNEKTSLGTITQNNIVYEIFDGNEAYVMDGSAATGTVQIPDAVYANGTYYVVTKINKNAFKGNENITAVDMQYASGLKDIEYYSFADCKNLETVALPFNLNVDLLFMRIFDGCDSLSSFAPTYGKNYTIIDGVIYNQDSTKLLMYPSAKTDTSFTINEGVLVGRGAFLNLKYLKNINVPEELTENSAGDIINKYSTIITASQNGLLSVNGVDIFTFADDDSAEPQISPVFQNEIYNNFTNYNTISNYYAKRYAQYVVKKYIDMENDTDIIKALKLHNWLCSHVKYDPVVSDQLSRGEIYIGDGRNHCDESVFLHYEKAHGLYEHDGFYTVCDGYSRAYSLLLNTAGVCCEAVDGDPVSGKYGHAWNIVELNAYDNDPTNDRYYYVDTTWDDNNNGWSYSYFLRSNDPDDFNHSSYKNWSIYTNHSKGKLTQLPEKTFSIKTIGDMNGDNNITVADLRVIEDYENSSCWSDLQRANADLNFDGVIDGNDVDIISDFINARIGDINGDCEIDEYDYLSFEHYYKFGFAMPTYMLVAADINMDGVIDETDLEALKPMIGQSRETVNKFFFEHIFGILQQAIPEELK